MFLNYHMRHKTDRFITMDGYRRDVEQTETLSFSTKDNTLIEVNAYHFGMIRLIFENHIYSDRIRLGKTTFYDDLKSLLNQGIIENSFDFYDSEPTMVDGKPVHENKMYIHSFINGKTPTNIGESIVTQYNKGRKTVFVDKDQVNYRLMDSSNIDLDRVDSIAQAIINDPNNKYDKQIYREFVTHTIVWGKSTKIDDILLFANKIKQKEDTSTYLVEHYPEIMDEEYLDFDILALLEVLVLADIGTWHPIVFICNMNTPVTDKAIEFAKKYLKGKATVVVESVQVDGQVYLV